MSRYSRLEQLGFDTHSITEEQIAVIDSLSDAEIQLLVKIKNKLDDAGGDVEGHSVDSGGVVW